MAQAKQVTGSLDRDYDIGGARARPLRVISGSRVVFEVGDDRVAKMPDVATDPPVGIRGFFFRVSGDKEQLCVRFGSGTIQVLATEP